MFENTYLVTDKLETYTDADVDAAEAALGTRFPEGYREYMTTLGRGEYCDYVNVSPPEMIVKNQTGNKPPLLEFCHSWDGSEFGVTPERLAKAIMLGNSIDGDWIIFETNLPDAVYVLPESEDVIDKAGATLLDGLNRTCNLGSRSEFRYFSSNINQKQEPLPDAVHLSLDHFQNWIADVGEYDYLDLYWNNNPGVTLDMFAALNLNMETVAPELGIVTAFYKSFGGYVSASAMSSSGTWVQLVHDAEKDTPLMQKILDYMRSKAA